MKYSLKNIDRNFTILLFSAISLILVGCATGEPPKPQFVESPKQTLLPPPADKAQIIFLEPINSIQGLIPVGLFEVNGESRTWLQLAHTAKLRSCLLRVIIY